MKIAIKKSQLFKVAILATSIVMGLNCDSQAQSGTRGTAHPAMMNPSLATEQAPAKFKVKFTTTKGDFVAEVNRDWSPNGADRFYNLIKIGYFKDTTIFRAIPGFMFQFGIHGDPKVNEKWSNANFNDDPSKDGVSNLEGYITYAKSGAPNSRSVQFFVNLGDNAALDRQNFTPFAKVIEGMEVVRKVNTEYGENKPGDQDGFQKGGAAFIRAKYPNLDSIKSVTIVPANEGGGSATKEGSGSR